MNIGIVFGGKSVEHDVSIVTAKQIYSAKPNCLLLYIDKDGKLNLYNNSKFELTDFKNKPKLSPITLVDGYIYLLKGKGYKKYKKLDCAIMCTHGGDGENGKVVSMLNVAGVPTTAGSGLALGISMDKWLTKICLKGLGLPCVGGFCADRKMSPAVIDKLITKNLGYPVIIKPNGGGSSIGIQVAKNFEELGEKLQVALEFDDSVIIERELQDFIEYNCAVYGDKDNCYVSKIDQPLKKDEILSFTDKYLSGGKSKSKGMKGQSRTFPANLPEGQEKEIQEISKQIFTELGFNGVVRIDFMYEQKTKKLYVNEINAIPGSLGVYFFTNKNLSSTDFIDKLVEIAIKNYNDQTSINKNYITKLF